jgi:hypothetical protein
LVKLLGKVYTVPLPFGKYKAFVNWENATKLPHVPDFRKFYKFYIMSDRLIGFNSISFDDNLLCANNIPIKTDFDLLCEVREAVGMPRRYVKGKTRGGYNLNNLAIKNGLKGKTGTGELAPKLWQDGRHQEVIDYCLNDVKLLKQLYFKFQSGFLRDPHSGKLL